MSRRKKEGGVVRNALITTTCVGHVTSQFGHADESLPRRRGRREIEVGR